MMITTTLVDALPQPQCNFDGRTAPEYDLPGRPIQKSRTIILLLTYLRWPLHGLHKDLFANSEMPRAL